MLSDHKRLLTPPSPRLIHPFGSSKQISTHIESKNLVHVSRESLVGKEESGERFPTSKNSLISNSLVVTRIEASQT